MGASHPVPKPAAQCPLVSFSPFPWLDARVRCLGHQELALLKDGECPQHPQGLGDALEIDLHCGKPLSSGSPTLWQPASPDPG